MANIILAGDIKVGTQLAESDGFLFDVVEVVKEPPPRLLPSAFAMIFQVFVIIGRLSRTAHPAEFLKLSANPHVFTVSHKRQNAPKAYN